MQELDPKIPKLMKLLEKIFGKIQAGNKAVAKARLKFRARQSAGGAK